MKLSKKFVMPVVYVEWVDSCSTGGWNYTGKGDRPANIRSVGILVRETKKSITLTASLSEHGSSPDQMSIPRCVVRKMRRLS